jgi:hypothetical protein
MEVNDMVRFGLMLPVVRLCMAALLLGAAPLLAASDLVASEANDAASNAADKKWRFRVYLDDKEIGYHHFLLQEDREFRRLRTEANFEVRLLFLKLYEYEHVNVETWQGNCLVRLESRTDANGRPYRVAGERAGDHFRITSDNGRSQLPGCIMSFAYWNPEFLQQRSLLNTQNGDFIPVTVSRLESAALAVDGDMRMARKYRVRAEGLELLLWYSEDGDWLALETVAGGGRKLRYERTS